MTPFPPPLASLIAQFEAVTAEARALAKSVGEEAFLARDGKRWSAADCLAHLSATNERYLRALAKITATAAPAVAPRYEPTLVGRIFKWMMEPPARLPLRAPKIFRPPAEARPLADVLSEFETVQARITESIGAAANLDFAGVTMRSPASRLLKMNLVDAYRAMAAHERRHLWQARRAIEG